MTFYTFIERGEPALYSYERLYALISHGLFTLESLIYKGILKDVYFDYVNFNGLAFERGRKENGTYTYIANFYNTIDKRFDVGKTEEFIGILKRFIRENKIWYPYFDTATLTISITWAGTVMDVCWYGHLTIRGSRSFEGPKRYGDIVIDLVSPIEHAPKDNWNNLSDLLMDYIINDTGLTEKDFIDLFEYLIHPEKFGLEPSDYHSYKKVKYSMFSTASMPLKTIDESFAMAISSIKSLPRLIASLLKVISKAGSRSLEGVAFYAKNRELVKSMYHVFKTINPVLLSGRLSTTEVRDRIVEYAIENNVREIIPSSILVADRDSLRKFVKSVLDAYNLYLKDIYDDVKTLWYKLNKWR